MTIMLLAAVLATQSSAPARTGQPDLGWMAGYWLSCENGVEVSETWSSRRGGVMMGYGITFGRQAFLGADADRNYRQPPKFSTSFPGRAARGGHRLLRAAPARSSIGHDFPQRVIYRRSGDRLTGRIEGLADGREQAMEWHYVAAPLNRHCPAPSPNR